MADAHDRSDDEVEHLLKEKVQLLSVLMRSGALERGEVAAAVREMTEIAADVLEVDRVGFWRFAKDQQALELVDLFVRSRQVHESGLVLTAAGAPRYFDAIREERSIAADDARVDPRTSEFAADYLAPLGIGAMLDAPVVSRGLLLGVVCHEHVGGARRWRAWEELAAGTFADCVALALDAAEARAQRAALQKAHDDLERLVYLRTESLKKSEASFRQLFQAAPVAMALTNPVDSTVIEANARASELFQIPPGEERGLPTPEFWVHSADREAALQTLAREGRLARVETKMRAPLSAGRDGRPRQNVERWIDLSAQVIEHQGAPALLVGFLDITQMKEAEAALEASRRTLEMLLAAAPVPLVLTRMRDATVLFCNERAGDLFGATPAALLGRRAPEFYEDLADRARFLERVERDGRVAGFAARMKTVGGRAFWALLDAQRFELGGDDVLMVGFTDVSEQKAVEERLREQVSTDGLTGALTRRRFFEIADGELERADRYERPLSLAMIDLDHFKAVNDRYGHQAGDEALRHVTRVIRETLRGTDHLGRYGGEELAVLLPETTQAAARDVIDRVREAIAAAPARADGNDIPITVSAGVAGRQVGESLSSLFERADDALYAAKRAGRNRVVAAS